jgi:photosystem II stability/assembly factor-like uncharacterized protein
MKIRRLFSALLFISLCPYANAQWLQQSNGLPGSFYGLAIDACDSNTAVISIQQGLTTCLFRSVDGGASWHQLAPLPTVSDVSMVDSSHIWVVTDSTVTGGWADGFIYASSDAGQHWTVQYHDPGTTGYLNYIKMFDLLHGIAMGDPAHLGNGPPLFAKTTDGGAHWIPMNDTLSGDWSSDTWRQLSLVTPDIGYFYASGNMPGLYKTTTGGSAWAATSFPNVGVGCDVVKFYNEDVGLVIPGPNPVGRVYRTFDGGATWEWFASPHRVWAMGIAFAPGDPSKVWSADTGYVYFSSDTGRTWLQQLSVPGKYVRDLVFADAHHGWVLADNYVYHTSNGGAQGPDAVSGNASVMPAAFSLEQNYPNPFNPTTNIQFTIVHRQLTIVKVFDVLGREVATLVNEVKQPGTYTVEFSGSNLASGVYFYRLQAGDFVQTKHLLLLK